ncbi:TerB family tellurite resistance protein [Nereida sp. MMG025]|uniref:tellurite resistance TerB family protein n=1 Tax=Nereida sp. MMG025 TaxID=2909981 RepID=UPI001F3A5F12|nr:TerB family tellurite resistance protein [Nereida sp. MMG025]MCF6443829.1 TerB family tellurite resistance protein [Nereida sp. MMG025]
MLSRIFGVISRPQTVSDTPLPSIDPRLSLVALFVRVAKIDGTYNLPEISTIDRILSRRFDINALAAAQMRASGERLEREMPQTDVLAKVIADNLTEPDLNQLLADVWAVVLCDAVENPAEAILIERVETLIDSARTDAARTGTTG